MKLALYLTPDTKITSDGGVPIVTQQNRIGLASMRMQVRTLALLSGLRTWHCRELWCRWQTWLGSGMVWLWHGLAAAALIGPLAWELPYAVGTALKRQKNKTKQNTDKWVNTNSIFLLCNITLHEKK